MALALVGTIGSAVQVGSGALTLAWGTNQNRTAGNLLICWHGTAANAVAALPSTPSGWSIATQETGVNTFTTGTIFYKIATGADAVPTFGSITNNAQHGQLAEFSGNAFSSPLDQHVNFSLSSSGVSPNALNASSADQQAAQLVIAMGNARYTGAATKTLSHAFNNGATATDTNNNSTSNAVHYAFSYGITTGNGSADQDSFTFSTSVAYQGGSQCLASFKVASHGLLLAGVGT